MRLPGQKIKGHNYSYIVMFCKNTFLTFFRTTTLSFGWIQIFGAHLLHFFKAYIKINL